MIGVPYGKRDDRHAIAGLSHVGSPAARDSARMSALPRPASISGAFTPRSRAETMPGRWSPRSSTVAP